jgi:hypothetical protein
MVKALHMNHQDFRKSVDGEVFLNTHLLLASFAFVPTVYHLLCLDELVQAVLNSDVTRDAIRLPGDFN